MQNLCPCGSSRSYLDCC
ncbi:MAG: SEC-C domain-containing protein [Prolixibacteraceae bacterium]|nr:SEC-C domain-containing protein [Prolixibacteraceae bacterium]